MENNKTIIYTYRYMWQVNKKGDLNKTFIKVLSASSNEHRQFIEMLQKDKTVTIATRIYISEYDVNLFDVPEIIKPIKENKKDGEKNETSKSE